MFQWSDTFKLLSSSILSSNPASPPKAINRCLTDGKYNEIINGSHLNKMNMCSYFIPAYGRAKKNMTNGDHNPPKAVHAYHLPN
jgi:hypothetical protein